MFISFAIFQDDSIRDPSPSLLELESKKIALLEELGDNSNSNLTDKLTAKGNEGQEGNESTEELYQTIDETGVIDVEMGEGDDNTTMEGTRCNNENTSTPVTSTPKMVKKSIFGTPVLKSASPFSTLPRPENFMVGVSDVINFENLPNSTGKYEQMTDVLSKVRKTLKSRGKELSNTLKSLNQENL